MRPFFILTIALLFSHFSWAQGTVGLKGTIKNPKNDVVYVKYYEEYVSYAEAIADSAIVDKKGNFSMLFNWDQSYPAYFYHGDEMTELFLSPGDDLSLTLDTKEFDETIAYKGEGSIVNNYIAQKTLRFPGVDANGYKSPELEFTKLLDSVLMVQMNFYKEYFSSFSKESPSTDAFIVYEQTSILYNWATQKMQYPSYNRYLNKLQKPVQLSPGYYDYFDEVAIYNPEAMKSYYYLEFLSGYVDREIWMSVKEDTMLTFDTAKDKFINNNLGGVFEEYILAEWAFNKLTDNGDIETGQLIIDKLEIEYPNSQYLGMLKNSIALTSALQPGNKAPEFTLEDIHGKMVSLSDFKGKIVYLDIWASWCGPCLGEIPEAKKLEEEMNGKDIVFLCVSVDESKQNWKNSIQKYDMSGIHLISKGNFESEITQLYNVHGIPHYVIIGRGGEIIDADAKRPSMGAKKELEKLLD